MVFLLSRAILLLAVLFWIWCILDVIRAPAAEIRYVPKVLWLAFVVLIPTIGSLGWLLLGRPETLGSRLGSRLAGSERPPAAAPDDSPDFLRQVDDEIRRRRRAEKLRKPPDASDKDVDEEIKRLEQEFRRRNDDDPKT
jgi:hypothetical protein